MTGPAEAVVLVHGWACSSADWADVLPALRRSHHVVAWDLPGHGGRPASGPAGVEAFADETAALVEGLGAARVQVVGHSMGAAVALELVRRHPQLPVSRVVALESLHHAAVYPRQPAELVDAVMAAYEGDFPGIVDAAVEALAGPACGPTEREQIARHMKATPRDVALAAMRSLLEWDRDAALAQTTTRVEVVASSFLLDGAARAALEPRCTVTTTEAGGHFLPLEAPAATAALLLDLL